MAEASSSGTEAARRSEEELREAIEIIPAMVFIAFPGPSNVFTNRAWREYTGLSAHDTSGSGWQTAIHPEDLERHAKKWEASSPTGEPFEDEARFRRASDGQYRWFLVRAVPLRNEQGSIIRWYGVLTDIEERKQAENAVRRSEAYLAEAHRLAHTGSWAWNPLTEQGFYWSEEMFRIFEWDPHQGFPTSETFWQRIHPDDRESMRELLRNSALEKTDYTHNFRIVVLDGSVKHLHGIGRPVLDLAGELVEYVGTTIDVTERKRAEEALTRLNRELRAISDCNQRLLHATDEQCLIDEICRIVCEEAGYRMAWVGYAEQDEAKTVRPVAWAGVEEGYLSIVDVSWSEETERGLGPTGTAIRSGTTCYCQDFTTDARLLPWRESALCRGYRSSISLPLKDEHAGTFGALIINSSEPKAFTAEEIRLLEEMAGDLAYGIVNLRSRAARKQAEQELILLSSALAKVTDETYLVDETGRFHYINEAVCRRLGYTRAELLGMGVADIDPEFPPQRWLAHWNELKTVRALTFESVHRTRDGRVLPVEISANYFEYGGRAYNLALVRDITERKQAEEARLEARVSERTRIARELHDTLLQSFQALLLRFQTVSLLLPERPTEAREKLESAIEQAAEAITEGRDAVQGLRESTVERNDLAQAIRTLGEELAEDSTNQPPVAFHVSVEGEPRNLHPSVRDEIYKISAEAIRNAFRHADAKQVAVGLCYEEEQVRLRLRDDGKGIDPEVLLRKRSEGHYGVPGMRERATIIGGNLELRSKVGGGTEIELCVPASKAYAGTAERIPSFKSIVANT
jgi:PAS domain S-box-containing protein